ncbi:MAG: formylglycine-generating enzyme family protein [Akkermansiaceae bacterium]|nr:formylglycine-generating enzyme family protein [Akkermansiaceae bacterium]
MSDLSENLQAAEEAGLRVVCDSSLALLPKGASPAMDEMVSRSLAQIQVNPASGLSQRGGEMVAPRRAGDEREFEIAPGVKIVMCWIPAGEFLMGSPEDEEGRGVNESQVQVKLSRGFWLGQTQVTQAQWQAVMGNDPSSFKGVKLPVETVSWHDAQEFIAKINASCRLLDGMQMALPTEAQWEYACRAGETGPYSGGSIDQVAWHCINSEDRTHAVGTKNPNAWGLYDMHGNVEEWCADWYGAKLKGGIDPQGASSGPDRVIRGGSWFYTGHFCRAAGRNGIMPFEKIVLIGFRVACSSVLQNAPATDSAERS